ncbi:MAG: hypothetical protein WCD37_03580 [Chloroflexia bacterium]
MLLPGERRNPWVARIKRYGVGYYLGVFPTVEAAARAYDAAAVRLFGEFARLNFPEELALLVEGAEELRRELAAPFGEGVVEGSHIFVGGVGGDGGIAEHEGIEGDAKGASEAG